MLYQAQPGDLRLRQLLHDPFHPEGDPGRRLLPVPPLLLGQTGPRPLGGRAAGEVPEKIRRGQLREVPADAVAPADALDPLAAVFSGGTVVLPPFGLLDEHPASTRHPAPQKLEEVEQKLG